MPFRGTFAPDLLSCARSGLAALAFLAPRLDQRPLHGPPLFFPGRVSIRRFRPVKVGGAPCVITSAFVLYGFEGTGVASSDKSLLAGRKYLFAME